MLTPQEKREAAKKRLQREIEFQKKRDKFTSIFFLGISFLIITGAVTTFFYKKNKLQKSNTEKLAVVQEAYRALNQIESDFIYTYNINPCHGDMLFEKTRKGFIIYTVKHPSQIMKVRTDIQPIHNKSIPVELGYDILAGDEIILCNNKGYFEQISLNAIYEKGGQYFLITTESIGDSLFSHTDLYAVKTVPIEYIFEDKGSVLHVSRIEAQKEKVLAKNITQYQVKETPLLTDKGDFVITFDVFNPGNTVQSEVRLVRKIPLGVNFHD